MFVDRVVDLFLNKIPQLKQSPKGNFFLSHPKGFLTFFNAKNVISDSMTLPSFCLPFVARTWRRCWMNCKMAATGWWRFICTWVPWLHVFSPHVLSCNSANASGSVCHRCNTKKCQLLLIWPFQQLKHGAQKPEAHWHQNDPSLGVSDARGNVAKGGATYLGLHLFVPSCFPICEERCCLWQWFSLSSFPCLMLSVCILSLSLCVLFCGYGPFLVLFVCSCRDVTAKLTLCLQNHLPMFLRQFAAKLFGVCSSDPQESTVDEVFPFEKQPCCFFPQEHVWTKMIWLKWFKSMELKWVDLIRWLFDSTKNFIMDWLIVMEARYITWSGGGSSASNVWWIAPVNPTQLARYFPSSYGGPLPSDVLKCEGPAVKPRRGSCRTGISCEFFCRETWTWVTWMIFIGKPLSAKRAIVDDAGWLVQLPSG